ncbi:hypothetical protein PG993_011489 [Apiospora rasikravindrae]|uniref:C3H1-type domain-containing protein n=1 Tax=Apiospora rasikravindrae TaxID=990691 RepID=A0ABR1SEJ4_9PEZI
MDSQENMVMRGMNSIHSGLGILLGAGRISSDTHRDITALLNNKNTASNSFAGARNGVAKVKGSQSASWRATAGPNSVAPLIDLEHQLGNITMSDRSSQPFRPSSAAWHNDNNNHKTEGGYPPNGEIGLNAWRYVIACPWFLNGYDCREQAKGQCPWIHENDPDAIKEPLICHFWADNNRCRKSDKECRYAHFDAKHGQLAPAPKAKSKKRLENSFSFDDEAY